MIEGKMTDHLKGIAIEVVCFLLILLFLYAAFMKLIDHQKFLVQLGQSPMLTSFAGVVSWGVPVCELSMAGMLIFHKSRYLGLIASYTMMTMFTLYIIIIKNFSSYVPCSCGGVLQNLSWDQHLVFNIAFVLLSLISIALYRPSSQSA